MYYFATSRIEQAIEALSATGASDYFKTYLVLKAFGLSMDSPTGVAIDTNNTLQAVQFLFGVEGLAERLKDDRPFYNPLVNEPLKEHASRSVIQTHVKRFHDGSIPISIDWLMVNQRPDRKWQVKFSADYPMGLGQGKDGLARRDEEQISISTEDFLVWLYRYGEFEQPPTYSELFEQMKMDLHLHEAEISLLFDKNRAWSEDPFATEPVDDSRLVEFIAQRIDRGAEALQPSLQPVFSNRKINRILGVFRQVNETKWWSETDTYTDALEVLHLQKSVLLVGPPGVGKTRLALQLAHELTGDNSEQVHFFQFHASHTYQSFIEALEAQTDDSGNLRFQPVPGRFLKIVEAAFTESQVVVLDELNRADVSRVFGEVLFLLEYRGEKHSIPRIYDSSKSISIPQDLYMVATMNDIDKSTFDVDFALRRRFGQIRLEPDPNAVIDVMRDSGCSDDDLMKICASLLTQVQQFYPLGHAYFLGVVLRDDLKAAYRRRIRPTIRAYLGKFREEELEDVDTLFGQAYEARTLEEFVGARD